MVSSMPQFRSDSRVRCGAQQTSTGGDTEIALSEIPRPRTRGECAAVPRPCPFASCRYSLLADVEADGRVRDVFGDRDVPPAFSCSLDVADTGGVTLERVGQPLRLTRERIRQVESKAIAKFYLRGGRQLTRRAGTEENAMVTRQNSSLPFDALGRSLSREAVTETQNVTARGGRGR